MARRRAAQRAAAAAAPAARRSCPAGEVSSSASRVSKAQSATRSTALRSPLSCPRSCESNVFSCHATCRMSSTASASASLGWRWRQARAAEAPRRRRQPRACSDGGTFGASACPRAGPPAPRLAAALELAPPAEARAAAGWRLGRVAAPGGCCRFRWTAACRSGGGDRSCTSRRRLLAHSQGEEDCSPSRASAWTERSLGRHPRTWIEHLTI